MPELNLQQAPENKPSWWSAHHLIGYVFLIVVAAAAIAGIYYWQTVSNLPSYQAPKHVDQTSADTSTWKTYTNSQYGFDLQYPSNWNFINLSLGKSMLFSMALDPITSSSNIGDEPINFSLEIYSSLSDIDFNHHDPKNLDDFIKSYAADFDFTDVKQFTINNISGYQVQETGLASFTGYYFIHAGKVFEVLSLNNAAHEQDLNKIILSFKFTN